jgi:exonuclease SbcC
MRPLRIRAEGFSAYRTPVEVDLDGVDFFSLSGATGSGKSSLIDAMVFALYGRVPRLGGSTVAPAISAGVDRARVAFDFEIDGSVYTAVRLVERTKTGGASVKEARLQKGESVLADGADDVTVAVEGLLKLRFEDFTRTVVLPQGDFAQFLTATKAERQSLLRSLLGLDMYTAVRGLAKTRAAIAGDRAETVHASLESLQIPDDESVVSAERRLTDLETLSTEIVEREKRLSSLDKKVADTRAKVDRLSDAATRLESISPPDQLERLDGLANDARDGVALAEKSLEEARTEVLSLETRLRDLTTPAQIATHRISHENLAELEERIAAHNLELIEAEVEALSEEFDETVGRLQETRDLLASARFAHAAHALVSTLVVGEPCPVCDHEVIDIPSYSTPTELEQLEADDVSHLQAREAARLNLDTVKGRLTSVRATLSEQTEQLGRLQEALTDIPNIEELTELESWYDEIVVVLEDRRAVQVVRDGELETARQTLDGLADAVRLVGKQLTAAQLEVADLKPPVSDADDVVVRWKDLISWRDEARAAIDAETLLAMDSVASANDRAADARHELTSTLRDAGVKDEEPHSAQVATELEKARQLVADFKKTLSAVNKLQVEVDEASSKATVAEALVGHLRANGFERWLMAGALSDLVGGANGLLGELSSGGYSLHSDDVGSFSIVDHRNADELRSVSTLSGGETFLVSLALALSLAETLAAAGGARLDTIILDEGFGTLDTESLDTVASVLEELAGDGLMVGVITHVKELAARAPTRFEVTREPTGSVVEKVS